MDTKTKAGPLELLQRYYKLPLTAIAFLFIFGFKYVTPFAGLTPLAMNVFGIFIGALIFWFAISIGWGSLVIMVALAMSPLFTINEVLAQSIGTWVISFIIFSQAICYVLGEVGFFRRCAVWILTRPLSQKSPWSFIVMLSVASIAIGSFLPTATAFMLVYPIVIEIFHELGFEKGDSISTLFMLVILIFTAFSVATTPIGHIMSIVGMGLYTRYTGGARIGFLQYSVAGVAVCAFFIVAMLLLMKLFYKVDFTKFENINTEFLLKDQEPMGKKEKISVSVFVIVVILWLSPDLFSKLIPSFAGFMGALGQSVPPIIGIVVLSIIEVDGEPIMDVADAMAKGVTWETILLVSAASILGDGVTHPDAGIAGWLAGHIAPALNGLSPLVCVLVIVSLTELITAFSSDLFTVTLMVNLTLPMVLSGQVTGINPAALVFVVSIASVIAICAPGTSPSAGVSAGSGWLGRKHMFSWGMMSALQGAIGLTFIAYPIAAAIMK